MAFDLSNLIEFLFASQDVKLSIQHPIRFNSNQVVYFTVHSFSVSRATLVLSRPQKARALQLCCTQE